MAGGVTGLIANRARVGYMDRQLRRLPRQPRSVGQLGGRLQEIWEQLPQKLSGAPSVFDEMAMYCRDQPK